MDGGRSSRALFAMLAWLAHPVTLLAVVVLAVNDHLLKTMYPGLITGKLSDFAGLVVAPPLLAVAITGLAPRLPANPVALASLAVSGAAFTVVKATATGSALASALWSAVTGPSVILADRSDLVALPALVLAGWLWTRARQRPASRRAIRRFGVFVALPAAALAVGATSAPEYPDTVAVASWRNLIVIGQANAYHDRQVREWLVSDQDGRAWRWMTTSESEMFEQDRAALNVEAREACVPDEPAHCFRIASGHLRVEETRDASTTWTVSWEVSDGQRSYLARAYEKVGDLTTNLSSMALAVHPTPDGYIVVVANGRDGAAVRDASGHWTRIGFGAYGAVNARPPSLDADSRALGPEMVIALLIVLLTVGVGGWRAARQGAVPVTGFAVTLGVGGSVAILGALGLRVGDLAGFIGFYVAGSGLLAAFVGAIGVLVVEPEPTLKGRWMPVLGLVGLCAGVGWFAPFVGWAHGATDYWAALLIASVAAATGVVLAGWLGHRIGHQVAPLVDPPYPEARPAG